MYCFKLPLYYLARYVQNVQSREWGYLLDGVRCQSWAQFTGHRTPSLHDQGSVFATQPRGCYRVLALRGTRYHLESGQIGSWLMPSGATH